MNEPPILTTCGCRIVDHGMLKAGDFAMCGQRYLKGMLAVTATLASCGAPPPLSTPPTPPPVVSNAFDGTYRGTVRVTFVTSMAEPAWCKIAPQVSVQISNGILTYVQSNPGYPDNPTVTYRASVLVDASFRGESDQSTTITGSIAANHLTAAVDGLGCSYALVADRI